jgi:hypothetical protein
MKRCGCPPSPLLHQSYLKKSDLATDSDFHGEAEETNGPIHRFA